MISQLFGDRQMIANATFGLGIALGNKKMKKRVAKLLGEVRYLSVKKAYPNEAEELFAEAQKMAQLRYKTYIRKSQENWED